jgi:hypothetical protein
MSATARPVPSLFIAALVGALVTTAGLTACGNAPTEGGRVIEPTPVEPVPVPPAAVVSRVELDVPALTLDQGSTRRLVATPRDAAGNPLDRVVAWTSSDPLVAAVSADGVVTALHSGVVVIAAAAEGATTELRVSVRGAYAYDLLFDAPTGAVMSAPELWRLDLGAPDAAPALVSPIAGLTDAAVSPDGRRIAFVAHDGGNTNIAIVDRDGSGYRLVTSTPDNDDQPAWSPDGTRLAFHRWAYVGTPHDVWVVNVDGTGATNLTADLDGEQRAPTWSPRLADGSVHLAFAHVTRGPVYLRAQLYAMRDDGTAKRALTQTALAPSDEERFDDEPAWSPDGRTIAFVRTGGEAMGDVWLVDADGANARPLMRDEEPPFDQRAPAWSPDGALIAYASHHEIIGTRAGDWQLYTVRADGTGVVRRTSSGYDKRNPAWIAR